MCLFSRYVGVCSALKIAAAILFFFDLLLICYREKKELKGMQLNSFSAQEVISSIISLDRLSVFGWTGPETITETDEEQQPLGQHLQDSDYNSAMDEEDEHSSASSLPAPSVTQQLMPPSYEASISNRTDSIQIELLSAPPKPPGHRHSESIV